MEYFLRLANPSVLYVLVPLVFLIPLLRSRFGMSARYRFSLASWTLRAGAQSKHIHPTVFWWFHFLILALLAFFCAKPQLVDSRSKIQVQGVDIVLVLDASGSMQFKDYDDQHRSRFDVAKDEAIRFVEKRDHDAIGLVIFGNDALSRCPITHDKKIVKNMISELKLGDIDPDGTKLATAMVTAINRLKRSKAKSKIMILLTDGEPSEGDMDPSAAITIAHKLGIKVYTVGIGSEEPEVFMHPFYGMVRKPSVNKKLLDTIAQGTGGKSFMAHNAQDMRAIYDTIDALEKTEYETPIFSRYYDLFGYGVAAVLVLIFAELFLSTFVWFGI